eukprot:1071737-Amphidinium_carterae.1
MPVSRATLAKVYWTDSGLVRWLLLLLQMTPRSWLDPFVGHRGCHDVHQQLRAFVTYLPLRPEELTWSDVGKDVVMRFGEPSDKYLCATRS